MPTKTRLADGSIRRKAGVISFNADGAPCCCGGCICPPGELGGVVHWVDYFATAWPIDWDLTREVTANLQSQLPSVYGPYGWESSANHVYMDSSIDGTSIGGITLRADRVYSYGAAHTGSGYYADGRYPVTDKVRLFGGQNGYPEAVFSELSPVSGAQASVFRVASGEPTKFYNGPVGYSGSEAATYTATYNRSTNDIVTSWTGSGGGFGWYDFTLSQYFRAVSGAQTLNQSYPVNSTVGTPLIPAITIERKNGAVWEYYGMAEWAASNGTARRATTGVYDVDTMQTKSMTFTPPASNPWWAGGATWAGGQLVGSYPLASGSVYADQTNPTNVADSFSLEMCFDYDLDEISVVGTNLRNFSGVGSEWPNYYEQTTDLAWPGGQESAVNGIEANGVMAPHTATTSCVGEFTVNRFIDGVYSSTETLSEVSFSADITFAASSSTAHDRILLVGGTFTGCASGDYTISGSVTQTQQIVNGKSDALMVWGVGNTISVPVFYTYLNTMSVTHATAPSNHTFTCTGYSSFALAAKAHRTAPSSLPMRIQATTGGRYYSGGVGVQWTKENFTEAVTEVYLPQVIKGSVVQPAGWYPQALVADFVNVVSSSFPAIVGYDVTNVVTGTITINLGYPNFSGAYTAQSSNLSLSQQFTATETGTANEISLPANFDSYQGDGEFDCKISASCAPLTLCGKRDATVTQLEQSLEVSTAYLSTGPHSLLRFSVAGDDVEIYKLTGVLPTTEVLLDIIDCSSLTYGSYISEDYDESATIDGDDCTMKLRVFCLRIGIRKNEVLTVGRSNWRTGYAKTEKITFYDQCLTGGAGWRALPESIFVQLYTAPDHIYLAAQTPFVGGTTIPAVYQFSWRVDSLALVDNRPLAWLGYVAHPSTALRGWTAAGLDQRNYGDESPCVWFNPAETRFFVGTNKVTLL